MNNIFRFMAITALGLTLQAVSTTANATFIGSDLLIEWHFSSLGSVIESETSTVGSGIEFVERLGGPNIDVDATTIDFFSANALSFSPGSFNGFVFTDINDSIDDFLDVSISSMTGYTGFDLADINVTANRIEVNFASVGSILDPSQVQLTVNFASVPEPPIALLLGAGLLGIIGFTRRKTLS